MISYNPPAATGTLKPPILDGISNINAPNGVGISIYAENSQMELQADTGVTLNAGTSLNLSANTGIDLLSAGFLNLNADVIINLISAATANIIAATNLNLNGDLTSVIGTTLLSFGSNNIISFGNGIQILGFTTAQILALTPSPGQIVFCATINQMVYYQVSPITGITLGWYNSTGTIKL